MILQEYGVGPFKIIKIPSIQTERFLPEVSRKAGGGSVAETMYFVREAAEELLTRRALVYTVEQPTGARAFTSGLMIMDEDELNNARKARTFEGSYAFLKNSCTTLFNLYCTCVVLSLGFLSTDSCGMQYLWYLHESSELIAFSMHFYRGLHEISILGTSPSEKFFFFFG